MLASIVAKLIGKHTFGIKILFPDVGFPMVCCTSGGADGKAPLLNGYVGVFKGLCRGFNGLSRAF